jgi:hypothetical protein
VDPSVLVEETLPGWVPGPIAAALRADISALSRLSIFDPELESRLRDGILRATAWVSEVPRVERIYPDRARVELTVRRPAAAVDVGETRYLLDAAGRVIHEESSARPTPFPFAVTPVLGAAPSRRPAVGFAFPDHEVLNAVNVAVEMASLPEEQRSALRGAGPIALQVRRGAEVEGFHAGEVFLRIADASAIVRWGRPARYRSGEGQEIQLGLLEQPVDRKFAHLARVLDAFPRLRGLEEVRLDFDRPMYRPLGGAIQALDPEEGVEPEGARPPIPGA